MGVLNHQGGHARALTVFERLNDGVMLAVRVEQVVVHAWKVDFVKRNGMRGRKWDSPVALERIGDNFAARSLDNQRMELPVHIAVSRFVRQDEVPSGENFIPFTETFMQRVDETAGRPLFRQHTSRQAFECAADVDGIHDFLRRECPHHKTAGIELSQYPFLCQDG
jgi:hypothetical protein